MCLAPPPVSQNGGWRVRPAGTSLIPMTSKHSPRKLIAAERRERAWELRRAGWSMRAIAKEIGVSAMAVYKMLASSLAEIKAETLELARLDREIQLEQLDTIFNILYPRALRGELTAIDRIIKVMDSQAKLRGTLAPTKSALTDPTGEHEYNPYAGLTDEQRLARIQEVISRLAKQPPNENEDAH